MPIKEVLYKQTCDRWLHKETGNIVYLDSGYDFGTNNLDWFKIPNDATIATYSDNGVRSDVLLFWRDDKFRANEGNCFDPKYPVKGWFVSGALSIEDFLTHGTYKGKIIWSLFK